MGITIYYALGLGLGLSLFRVRLYWLGIGFRSKFKFGLTSDRWVMMEKYQHILVMPITQEYSAQGY